MRTRRFRQLRFAVRHPVRTLGRNQHKAIERTHFGLGQLVLITGFVALVLVWHGRMLYPQLIP
ncbi:hypothetical protein [Streptomyces albus]|uniref:hypothetical protein n=1 Tax=Streptomyces albus TaxID=1888 RepID=UPI003F1E3CAC